jgi:DNA-binding PadR family transcriptional regulator
VAERALAPGDWAILSLLVERPAHGWALGLEMGRTGAIGQVWTVGRPLVYRTLGTLEQRGLIERVGDEKGSRGPNRELFQATAEGRRAAMNWLAEPVTHVRDIRSLLLLKLLLLVRTGRPTRPLLEAQRAAVLPVAGSLRAGLETSRDSQRILLRFRLESTLGVIAFIDGVLADPPGSPAGDPQEQTPART